jgi:hypothetical protein
MVNRKSLSTTNDSRFTITIHDYLKRGAVAKRGSARQAQIAFVTKLFFHLPLPQNDGFCQTGDDSCRQGAPEP